MMVGYPNYEGVVVEASAIDTTLSTSVEFITPAIAEAWLEKNVNNRPTRRTKLAEFATAMLRGEWMLNGEAIKFDWDGNLTDGQHRLLALIDAGRENGEITIPVLVIRGLDPSAQMTMDQGLKRTFSDTLRWLGEKNVVTLGSAVRILDNFLRTGIVSSQQHTRAVTKELLLETLDAHPQIRACLSPPQGDRVGKLLTPASAAALYYLFRRVDEDDAWQFFWLLGGGDGEVSGSLAHLRNVLHDNVARTHEKMDVRHRSALTIKAFNAWRGGTDMKIVRFSAGGARPERFPTIDGLDLGPKRDVSQQT